MARKGFYEELKIKEYLGELTPKMFRYVIEVMDGADDKAKERMVEKILPKIIDKGLPTMITGDEGGAIIFKISQEIAQKNGITSEPVDNSEGQPQV
jgi:hypothetical protein